ncbi:unnamed protein product [Boreogadus saida]
MIKRRGKRSSAGKSLCYQLPACLSAGVTVVISPLKSLILDQIQKLTALGIEARTLSGDQGYSDAESIYEELSEIKLLYVTPEKLSINRPLIEALQDLFANGLLARKMAGNPAYQGHDSPEKLKAILRTTFHLKEFRDNQLEAINATFEGKNVFVVGDNGAGKSLCYQLPACLSRGVTVVISPTISLIQDQMQNLTELGESMSISGPLIEALQSLLGRGLLARFVIDEAQCISQYDSEYFRPAFRTLNKLQQDFRRVPMIALSGPVRVIVQEDILNHLQMTNPRVFTMSFNRTNLKYAVKTRRPEYLEMDCTTWIKDHWPNDSGIIYCRKRDQCDSMASSLKMAGLKASSYHGGISNEDRETVQNEWKGNKCQIICATAQSFGFGIDKPDVRYVIHNFLPKSMENYYRESGRAGRDGKMSESILFYSKGDNEYLSKVIRINEFDDDEPENRELVNIEPMAKYCQNTVDCRRQQLLTYLGWGDIEANICLPDPAICDNCERANAGGAATG